MVLKKVKSKETEKADLKEISTVAKKETMKAHLTES